MGPPPQYPSSYPPPHIYYVAEGHPLGQPVSASASHGSAPPIHLYPPPSHDASHERSRPPMSLTLPQPPHFPEPGYGYGYPLQGPLTSPYQTPGHGFPTMSSEGSGSGTMTEYFPSFSSSSAQPSHSGQPPFPSPSWPPASSRAAPTQLQSARPTGNHGAKTSRQQFTACGACRHRRVKCDLKEKQDTLERETREEEEQGVGPMRGMGARRRKAICTNCEERGTNCVDEYAPLKAAKQLRRGKRISEIEMLYGKTAANAAVAANPDEVSDESHSPKDKEREEYLPELTKEFFDSPFFRRFQIQRPVLDPHDFVGRYLSRPKPNAAAMGPEGAILCHILYAWAVSYGVDERGQLDVPEGGGTPLGPLSPMSPGENEVRREGDRQRRFTKMKLAVQIILREIDECGVMRKPSWDGVRALLLILPLTEGVSTSMERLAMYETALNQSYALCSFSGLGYDGRPSGASGVNGGSDHNGFQDVSPVRVRIYWYSFVHEGITTGLKGGRLHLDDGDLDTIQDSIHNRAVVLNSNHFRSSVKLATAPINLALACRLINKALTGPSAKRGRTVNGEGVKEAWESLERCWEEFDNLKYTAEPNSAYSTSEDLIRFADGWKIFLFEAQNIIRKNLEERLAKLTGSPGAHITDHCLSPGVVQAEAIHLQHLLEISRSKCEVQTRQIMEIVKRHVGSRFFEWDASLVRDGTYYAAMVLAREGGSDEDIAICLQALNELRWAHGKSWERSADLRREWAEARNMSPNRAMRNWSIGSYLPPPLPPLSLPAHEQSQPGPMDPPSLSDSPYTSPGMISPSFDLSSASLRSFASIAGQQPPQPPLSHHHPQQQVTIMPEHKWPARIDGVHADVGSYAVYGSMPGPPPLAGGSQGEYVVQPDGSQAFVPYSMSGN